MKQNELPLRDRIVAHLKNTGEATAHAITKAVGMADTPSRVTKELNAMRTDAVVEAERKGKGPDLTYWLAVAQAPLPQAALPQAALPQAALPGNIRANTRAAQIWQALPEHGQRPMLAREIVAATGMAKETIAPALTGMVKAGQVRRIDDGLEYAYTRMPTASQPAEIPLDEQKQEVVPAETAIDPSDLSEVELADRAATMIDDAVDEISELQQRVSAKEQALQQQAALVAELRRALQASTELLTEQQDAAERAVADLTARLVDKDAELLKQAAVVVDLRTRLDAALIARGDSPLNPTDEDPSVDILQVAKAWHVVAKGYTIASATSIKAADRIARQLVRREGETVTVGAWVPMFRFKPSVEVRSAR